MVESSADSPGIFSPRVLWRLPVIFLPAALVTGAVVLALYQQDLSHEHALYEQAADHQVDLHADIIRREVKSVESDLMYLANQGLLGDFLAGRPGSRQELQAEYVLFCRQRGVYDQIRYLDATGREQVRINANAGNPVAVPESELQSKADRYYFPEAMQLGRGEVFSSPFDLNVEHDKIEQPIKPMIRFATPVFDGKGVKQGIVILNYLGAALLGKLAEVSGGFAGSVWLVNREGFFLRGPTHQDEWGFMLGHDRTFESWYADEWPRLGPARRGQFHSANGLFTFRILSLRGLTAAAPRSSPENALMVVARISPQVLEGRTHRLLMRLLLLWSVVLVLLFVLAWYLASAGALRRHHERDLAESAARLRALSAQLLTAQEDERRSLSRDLHDELSQVVTSVTIDLQRALAASHGSRVPGPEDRERPKAGQSGDRESRDELIGRALHGTACLLDRIHEIASRLRPAMLDDLGLKDAVQSLLSDYERRTGIVTRAELSFDQVSAPVAVSENVYRILQEALTNVSKHAKASEVQVALRMVKGNVVLTVRDNGIGLPPAAFEGKRLGIPGMRERTELLNGVFVLKGEPGQGTEVRVTIPLPQESGVRSQGSGVSVGGQDIGERSAPKTPRRG
jgi:signal transduction histidine kinase